MAATEEDLWRDVLGSCGDEYKDLCDAWKQVEAKAQAVTAIAGIFLAAAFAWAKELPREFHACERALLCFCMFALVASILCAIYAMRVESTSLAPSGRTRRGMAEDLVRPGFDAERMSTYYRTLIRSWEETNSELMSAIGYKAEMVKLSQMLLGYAACLCVLLAILSMKGGGS